MNEAHFRKLENMYLLAPTNIYYKPQIRIGQGTAKISLEARPDMFHAAGAVHGSVYFKLLDDAAFFSANSLEEANFVLTANFTIYLTRPVSSGQIRAVGTVVDSTRSQFIAQSILYDSEEREIAHGLGSFARSRRPLTPEIGYKLRED